MRSSLSPKSAIGLSPKASLFDFAAAWNSFARIAPQALTTADVALAVVFDPPAMGPAGSALSPSSTVTMSTGTPS